MAKKAHEKILHIFSLQRMKIRTSARFCYICIRMAKMSKIDDAKSCEGWTNKTLTQGWW
jgi:hypothetical protein